MYTKGLMETLSFNPRPREEGDVCAMRATPRLPVSIHALVKRATCGRANRAIGRILFQSTPS